MIDHDALALEVMKQIADEEFGETLDEVTIEFARRYRKALAEKMEPVCFLKEEWMRYSQCAWGDDKAGFAVYSLEDWK